MALVYVLYKSYFIQVSYIRIFIFILFSMT